MDKEHLDILLQNDEVKKAMAKAGEDALKNPEVQAKMVEAAKKEFPHMADSAQEKISEWANDPEAMDKAKSAATWAVGQAKHLASEAAEDAYELLQQGPTGVRVLAFIGSCAAFVLACWDVIKFWNAVLSPCSYVQDVWQVFFAFCSALFEAHPEHVQKVAMLEKLQDVLVEYAKFFTRPLGRGLFYFFQSSLWISEVFQETNIFKMFTIPMALVRFGMGCYLFLMGMFNVWMHMGIMPVQGLNKTKAWAAEAAVKTRRTIMHAMDKAEDLREGLNDGAAGTEIELGPPTFKSHD